MGLHEPQAYARLRVSRKRHRGRGEGYFAFEQSRSHPPEQAAIRTGFRQAWRPHPQKSCGFHRAVDQNCGEAEFSARWERSCKGSRRIWRRRSVACQMRRRDNQPCLQGSLEEPPYCDPEVSLWLRAIDSYRTRWGRVCEPYAWVARSWLCVSTKIRDRTSGPTMDTMSSSSSSHLWTRRQDTSR